MRPVGFEPTTLGKKLNNFKSHLRSGVRVVTVTIIMLFAMQSFSYGYEFAEKWSKKDTAYQGVFLALLAVDYAQTHTMAKNDWWLNGELLHESCPILPSRPSVKEVDLYFAGCAVGHTIVSLALPSEAKVLGYKINPRRIWQGIWIGIESGYVGWNYSLGVRIEF